MSSLGNSHTTSEFGTKELLELASLDSLGLLDGEERRAFERAFAEASPGLQAQLRREQERAADVSDILPDIEPPATLRSRVLSAVGEAIAAVKGQHEDDVIASMESRHWAIRGYVTPLWRAAAIGFATATVVLLGVGYSMHAEYQRTYQAFQDGTLSAEMMQSMGPRAVGLVMNPDAHRVALRASAASASAKAVVYIDPVSKEGVLLCSGIGEKGLKGEYKLIVVDDHGKVMETLAKFEGEGTMKHYDIKLTADPVELGRRLAIVASTTSNEVSIEQALMASTI